MYKPWLIILLCVSIFSFEECALNRSTFPARLRHCRWLCAIRDSQQKNTIQTCVVLPNHQNATVTKCVGRCLVKHEEDISNGTECQCQNGKCLEKSVSEPFSSSQSDSILSATSSSPSRQDSITTASEFSSSTASFDNRSPSASSSTPAISSSAGAEILSTENPSSTTASSALRLLEINDNHDEEFANLVANIVE